MRAQLSPQGELHLVRLDDGGAVDDAPASAWGPVDHLVGAVAGCFAKSCQMVQHALGEPASAVEAHVVARKAEAKPSRVGTVSIHYAIGVASADKAARIAKDAKRICTVTNSLNCEFELVN
ncbi:OsmC family protein [Mesorhizobium sp. LHD-90]|uniref:OsmC family protein n=1 Tax=Mesorhizobium sp. LHD-90 TaxID=3071414 RepID=UPI0027E1EEE2|nr:OsmC family protein [Mesorhizobium sp. LHD-90]MDQ6435605.1 OsmC family protein [Mesorhizobium sp. LHD-90]